MRIYNNDDTAHSDSDGLADYEEVDWDNLIKNDDGTYSCRTFSQWENTCRTWNPDIDGSAYWGLKVLPVFSNPWNEDTDGDGLFDRIDVEQIKCMWASEFKSMFLDIDYDDYIYAMKYQYGFDELFSIMYLDLFCKIANSNEMINKNEYEIACEFNRIIASLCINYSGEAFRWEATVNNYSSLDAYNILINEYDYPEKLVNYFVLALNVQHGTIYTKIEEKFDFSTDNLNEIDEEVLLSEGEYKIITENLGNEIMRDFVHQAIQYVEFNDSLDIIDIAVGSTDRMISYSGDIISERIDESDSISDIDANNIQTIFAMGGKSFIYVQNMYNTGVINGIINPQELFVLYNGGYERILRNIEYDICSFFGTYITGENSDEKKLEKCRDGLEVFMGVLYS